ncbi:hypothetical protein M8C21_020814, partial [Ambrosia artemisiifolia]
MTFKEKKQETEKKWRLAKWLRLNWVKLKRKQGVWLRLVRFDYDFKRNRYICGVIIGVAIGSSTPPFPLPEFLLGVARLLPPYQHLSTPYDLFLIDKLERRVVIGKQVAGATKWKVEKTKVKVVLPFQFHTT